MRMLLLLAGFLVSATQSHAQNVSLTVSHWLPATHVLRTQVLDLWMKDVTEVTQGRVTFRVLPKIVGSASAQVDVVRDGLADVATIAHGYVPGRFVLQEIAELPFLGNNGAAVGTAYWRIYEKYLRKYNEHEGVVVLSVMASSAGRLHTTTKVVRNIDDFAGLKLRIPGGATTEIVKLLGAIPVLKPVGETYELVSTGVVDGTIVQMVSVGVYKMLDKLTHTTNIDGGLYNATYSLFINKGKWDSISAADQAAIAKVSGENLARRWGAAFDTQDAVTLKEATARGNVITEASPAFVADLRQRLKPVEEQWISNAKARNLAEPAAGLAEFREEIKKLQAENK
jgi:TRAP-type C4-dicarboxylate transport system substrate-binding protein